MASVEMIDRDPVESGSEVVRHLAHDIAGEGAQIGKPVAVLGRHIETELMAVLPPALHKLPPVDRVGLSPIQPPRSPSRVFHPVVGTADGRRLPCFRASADRSVP